jgi:hypothetical protein
MADSATETGLSSTPSQPQDAEAGEGAAVPETAAGMEAAGDPPESDEAETAGLNDDAEAAGSEGQDSAATSNVPIGGKKRARRGVAVPALLEAARTSSEPGVEARFRVFIIDTGWNDLAHKVLRKQIPLFDTLMGATPTYWLDRKTSVALLRKHRELIGRDPILCVHDLRAVRRRGSLGVHGLRLHLGLLRGEDALTRALQMVIHFLARHEASDNFEAEVRSRLQLEGLKGAVAIMAGGTPHNDLLRV